MQIAVSNLQISSGHYTSQPISRLYSLVQQTLQYINNCTEFIAQHVADSTRGNNTLDLFIPDFEGPVSTAKHPRIGLTDHAVVTARTSITLPQGRFSATLVHIWDDSVIFLALRTCQPSSMTNQITFVSISRSISSRYGKVHPVQDSNNPSV